MQSNMPPNMVTIKATEIQRVAKSQQQQYQPPPNNVAKPIGQAR